jgi:hypothetical protein
MPKATAAFALRPALVLGSGFHRHVLGKNHADLSQSSLTEWPALVRAVAKRMGVPAPSQNLSPTLQWEEILLSASAQGYEGARKQRTKGDDKVSVIEATARRHLMAEIKASSVEYPRSDKASIVSDPRWGCVISLNFDTAPYQEMLDAKRLFAATTRWVSSTLPCKENERLTSSIVGSDGNHPRVWFPNGSILNHATIRMGLHDYGLAPFGIRKAFEALKAWEKSLLNGKNARSDDAFAKIGAGLSEASKDPRFSYKSKSDLPLTWVAEFLYRPLVIAGCGLSAQEAGLWYLLVQRARNGSRIGRNAAPTRILISHEAKKDRNSIWKDPPFGIEPVICKDWDVGWAQILETM